MANISKHYQLSEEVIGIIHAVMAEKSLKSEVAAVTFLARDYMERKSLADDIADTITEKNKAWMERIRWATKTAEQNSQILIDVSNTILNHDGYEYCSHIEVDKNPVLAQSEQKIKEKIEYFKQEKDNRKRKNKE